MRKSVRVAVGSRKLVAIMFTDVVGFTSATRRNESLALELLREQETIVAKVGIRTGKNVRVTRRS